MKQEIRALIASTVQIQGGVDALADGQDLHAAGLTSFASVQLMLALEEAFDIEFPERMLNRKLFSSIDSIAAAVGELTAHEAAA